MYEVFGEGRPLVALHGLPVDHRLMSGCMEPVFASRTGWKRFYPDLPGMGQSTGADWIKTTDDMLQVVLEFIDSMIPGQNFIIAGESYGGYLAQGVIKDRPDMVDGVLLICPMTVADYRRRKAPLHTTVVKNDSLLQTITSGEARGFESFSVVQTQQTLERYLSEVHPAFDAADYDFLARLHEGGRGFSSDLYEQFIPFEKPSLIILGRQDSIVGYKDAWDIYDLYPRGSFVVLDRAGHNLQIEQADLFTVLVKEWLGRVEEFNAGPD